MSSSPKEKNLSSLYLDLCKFEQNGEYERALKTCNKILHASPKDAEAFHCKVVCLIQMTKFEEAMNFINKNPDLSSGLYFEKAYCQYRLNIPEASLNTINSAPKMDHQLSELKAQVLYRLEKYEESYSLYRDIIKNTNDDYDDERQANLNAVAANIKNASTIERNNPTYEMLYNIAYEHILNGKYIEAERKLRQCEKLCREFLEEDGCSEEEIEQELAIIKVQLAYCFQKQNRIKEAQQIYLTVLKTKSDDVGLVAVASNNIVTINKDQNVFDSKKKIKQATQDGLIHKLNSYQRRIIALNNCLLSFYISTPDACRKQCEKLMETWPELATSASIIMAVTFSKEGKSSKGIELLENLAKSNPVDKLYLRLTQVHLLLSQGEQKRACEILSGLEDVRYRPAIVGALVTLYMALGDESAAAKVFEDTVAYYRQHQLNQGDSGNMWMQAAEFHMRHGHPLVAAKSLEELLKNSSEDDRTIAKLIMAYVKIDLQKAKSLSKKLPSIKELTKNLNETEIETTTWIFGTKPQKTKTDTSSPATPKTDLIIKKKQRKRKGKLPKNYNPEVTPDPERWLPKYERTGFRKKRDRRQKDIIKGSQGTSSGQADVYDYTKVAEQHAQESPKVDQQTKTPGGNQRKQQQYHHKKKRKGR